MITESFSICSAAALACLRDYNQPGPGWLSFSWLTAFQSSEYVAMHICISMLLKENHHRTSSFLFVTASVFSLMISISSRTCHSLLKGSISRAESNAMAAYLDGVLIYNRFLFFQFLHICDCTGAKYHKAVKAQQRIKKLCNSNSANSYRVLGHLCDLTTAAD